MPAISTDTTVTEHVNNLKLPHERQNLFRDCRILERAWQAPTLIGREELLSSLERASLSLSAGGAPLAVSVFGPRGSGSSAVAAHVVATAMERLTQPGSKGTPLLLRADASACRSSSALVSALFREVDPGYDGRGASTEFSALLLLRRLRTMARPAIVWADQVEAKAAHVDRVMGLLAHPERLLPEGAAGLPTMLVVASGERNVLPEDASVVRTVLAPPQARDMCRAIMTRANLAFTTLPSLEAVEAIASLSISCGWGLSMVGELLAEAGRRAEARGGRWLEVDDVTLPANLARAGRDGSSFEALLLEVLRATAGATTVGKLRRALDARCQETGVRQPTQARMWRHLVGLERKGVVRREVRMGGPGGSRTLVHLRSADAET